MASPHIDAMAAVRIRLALCRISPETVRSEKRRSINLAAALTVSSSARSILSTFSIDRRPYYQKQSVASEAACQGISDIAAILLTFDASLVPSLVLESFIVSGNTNCTPFHLTLR